MIEPTDEEIDKVCEVAGENDYAFVAGLIATRTDAQWSRAKGLIDFWDAKFSAGKPGISIRGGGDAIYYLPTEAGNDIRARMRLVLGLPEVRDSEITGGPTTVAVTVVPVF